MVLSEPVLLVVGIGILAFAVGAAKILAAEAARTLDVHFLQLRAHALRHEYNRQVTDLRTETRPGAGERMPGASARDAGTTPGHAERAEAA
ncbi:MAG TPA: hypothetical protein VFF69_13670 [Phycisphaerales bacterium]|nr:hypothetical protein [Phycisphaerales bacterium]